MADAPARVPWRNLSILWVLLAVAAAVYSNLQHISPLIAIPVALAFLAELPFYVMAGNPPAWLRKPGILILTAVAPWLIYAVPTAQFGFPGLVLLVGIAMLIVFWYRIIPQGVACDILFVALLAAIQIAKVFDSVYLSPIPKVELSVLGHVMMIRTAAIAVIAYRGITGAEYRFLPEPGEWRAGLKWFALMLPPVLAALWATGLWTLREHPKYWTIIPQFLGILWVVALSEEFFFRGMLQNWMEGWTGNRIGGLLVTSLMFGSAHLWFRHRYPNWQFAIVAAVFGLFCGLAWREKRSVPTSMVTHALGATLYRVFFT